MAADPVATAASNNPLLKTLTAAVSAKLNPKVDLVSTFNGAEFTVFAPVDLGVRQGAGCDPGTSSRWTGLLHVQDPDLPRRGRS